MAKNFEAQAGGLIFPLAQELNSNLAEDPQYPGIITQGPAALVEKRARQTALTEPIIQLNMPQQPLIPNEGSK